MLQYLIKKEVLGFTLIETMVVIGITSVVGIALMSMITFVYKTNTFIFQQSTATDNARRGVEFALENLREATYGADGSYPIETAATSTVTFYADVDNDGTVERIRYYISGGSLFRGVANPAGNPPSYTGQAESTTTVAAYVQNGTTTPLFHYYDDTGTELATPADISKIASVSVVIGIDVDVKRAPVTFTLIGTATLRNLRSD